MSLLHGHRAFLSTCFWSRHLAGTAVELLQSLALHLQFHLRILFEDLRVSLAKHLSHPFIGYSSGTQPRGISGPKVVDSKIGNLGAPKCLVPNRLERGLVPAPIQIARKQERTLPRDGHLATKGFDGQRSEGYFGGAVWSFRVGNPDDRILKVNLSLDIDVLLRAKARERESVDRVKNLLSEPPAFQPSKADAFRYEKNIEGNVVQLDLLADLPRRREDESVLKIQGATSSLQVCLADGAENLGNHVETIQINCREGESLKTFEITVPDAVGFLILKTTVTRFREKARDPYDIYFYCRYSQDAATTGKCSQVRFRNPPSPGPWRPSRRCSRTKIQSGWRW